MIALQERSKPTPDERFEIEDLYAGYVSALDAGRYEDWPAFFHSACIYRIVPRENWDRGFPLSTLSFESRAMLEDRVYSIRETLFHEPYTMRHLVSNFIIEREDAGTYVVEANYIVIRTKRGSPELYSVGRCFDRIAYEGDALRFTQKIAVFDNELISNSLIYPI